MSLKKEFGQKIKSIREDLNLTQEKFAILVGLEPETISRIETGYTFVSATVLEKLSFGLGKEYKELFDFGEKKKLTKEDKEIELLTTLYKALDKKVRKAFLEGLKTFAAVLKKK